MFKKHAVQIKMVKDEPSTQDITVGDTLDAVTEMIEKSAKPAAFVIASVIGAKTASQIAVHIAKTYIR